MSRQELIDRAYGRKINNNHGEGGRFAAGAVVSTHASPQAASKAARAHTMRTGHDAAVVTHQSSEHLGHAYSVVTTGARQPNVKSGSTMKHLSPLEQKQKADVVSRAYGLKETDDQAGISVSMHDPGAASKKRMSVTVAHPAGAEHVKKAVKKAHKIAESHGFPTDGVGSSTYGYGDNHSTTCSYEM